MGDVVRHIQPDDEVRFMFDQGNTSAKWKARFWSNIEHMRSLSTGQVRAAARELSMDSFQRSRGCHLSSRPIYLRGSLRRDSRYTSDAELQ